MSKELFKSKFLVYDKLEEIEKDIRDYLQDLSQNTVLITGYQGSGKTTFVNYMVDNIKKIYNDNGKNCEIEKIDFEKENKGEEKENPFKMSLIERIVDNISKFNFVSNYYENLDLFKNVDDETNLMGLFEFLKKNLNKDIGRNRLLKKDLYKCCELLRVPQLLTIWSYLIICVKYCRYEDDFVEILLIDNIDNIYKDEYTEEFIRGIKEYQEIGSELISSLCIGNRNIKFNLYTNFAFVFCLRDTSAAKFSYHFTTRAVDFYHKDISEKVNKIESYK